MNYRNSFILLIVAITNIFIANAQELSKPIWESVSLPVPESVLYCKDKNRLYVSLIEGAGNLKDGKGGIAILNADGSINNAKWVENLNAPKGMAQYKNTLFVADLTALISIDITSGQIVEKIEIDSAVFLNDVAVDNHGAIYVSDTRSNKIFLIKNGHAELYMSNVTNANGLKWIRKKPYVLANTELWMIDDKKEITVVAKGFERPGDGLEQLESGDFIVTCWAGLVYHVKTNGLVKKMLDVQGVINTADLGYNKEAGVIYIPTFNNNHVKAYHLIRR